MDDINRILNKMVNENPELRSLFANMKPDKLKFPKGLKWQYYKTIKKKGYREWYCCWSITKNMNDKYISWIYEWIKGGKETKTVKVREHRKKKAAKTRAIKLYNQRMDILRKQEVSNV